MEAIDKLRELSKKLEDPYFIKEFEEGFEKFLKERDMKIYHTETQQDYDALMSDLEENGCKWRSGEKPTRLDKFKDSGKDTYIYEEHGVVSFSDGDYFKKYHDNETLIEYKAKGESMTQEEMKHNLQEVAKLYEVASDVTDAIGKFVRGTLAVEADLKEAKTSAKSLTEKIDEYFETLKPKFKVGDYVTFDIPNNKKIAKINRVNGDALHGLWYDTEGKNIQQNFYFSSDVRHTSPSEIAEYESVLAFHKHGRKPFEVKEGDILRDDKGNIFFVGFPNNFKKEHFTRGIYTFLKTAEEYNEWLKGE